MIGDEERGLPGAYQSRPMRPPSERFASGEVCCQITTARGWAVRRVDRQIGGSVPP